MKSVFFYGLFMDAEILIGRGLNPQDARLVYLAGYGLRIGERATLECSKDERAFGLVMQLPGEELEKLYSDKSLADYVPRRVVTTDMEGKSIAAITYILSMEKVSGSNSGYATAFAIAARKIDLPEDYIKEIEGWIQQE